MEPKSNEQNAGKEEGHAVVVDMGCLDTQYMLFNQGGDGEREFSYANKLSGREMDSLTALCDTLLPSVDPPAAPAVTAGVGGCRDEDVVRFFQRSASMAGTPEHKLSRTALAV
ncbi:hypothetical protein Ancab_012097 [Ancistrocladus abbreviatus]